MSTPQRESVCGFVAQDDLSRAAGMCLAAGTGWNLLDFTT
ncbi:hypothetical protein LCGC14_0140350 [marine sediment metagenome]|uniref:Uncharacterized protein n=1 Tax=marine sediment metagenome TaxID=412755 RepID=A0A0F9VHD1_9ZZZZ